MLFARLIEIVHAMRMRLGNIVQMGHALAHAGQTLLDNATGAASRLGPVRLALLAIPADKYNQQKKKLAFPKIDRLHIANRGVDRQIGRSNFVPSGGGGLCVLGHLVNGAGSGDGGGAQQWGRCGCACSEHLSVHHAFITSCMSL